MVLKIQLCWEVGRIDRTRDNDKAWTRVAASHRHITSFQEHVVHINQENMEFPRALLSDQNWKVPGEPATIIKFAQIASNWAQVA